MTTSKKRELFPPLWVLTLALTALVFWVLFELKEIVVLLVVGYCAAYIIDPLLDILEKKNLSRGLGVFLVFGALTLAIVILALTALPTIFRDYQELSYHLPDYVAVAKAKVGLLAEQLSAYLPDDYMSEGEPSIVKMIPAVSGQTVHHILQGLANALLKGYSVTLTIINLCLLPFIVYYLAVGFNTIHTKLLVLFPFQYRGVIGDTAREIDSYVAAYIRGQLMVCAILFLLYAVGLRVVGVQLWLLLAVIAGFGNMIPYLGFLLGIVLSSIMALVTFGSFFYVVMVWVVFGIVQFLEGTFITPKIVGEKVGLSPLVVIISIVAGGKLFGLLGIFLAIPGAAALRVVLRMCHDWVLEHYRQESLLGSG